MIYCVGHASDERLNSLWLFYGNIYAANDETYQRIKNTISDGIDTIPNVDFAETRELGRVNRVDLLGITNLRIRGMWQIQNPRRIYSYLHESTGSDFELVCIIPTEKYNVFPVESINRIQGLEQTTNFSVAIVEVRNPNNPASLIDCKLVKFCV